MAGKTLAEKVSTPEFRASVARHRAKLDAEDEGWTVMEPKRARALEAVARSLGRVKRHAWNGPWETEIHRAFDAHDRLERLSSRGSTALPQGTRKGGR